MAFTLNCFLKRSRNMRKRCSSPSAFKAAMQSNPVMMKVYRSEQVKASACPLELGERADRVVHAPGGGAVGRGWRIVRRSVDSFVRANLSVMAACVRLGWIARTGLSALRLGG